MISISNDSKHIKSWKYTKILFPKSFKITPSPYLINQQHAHNFMSFATGGANQ